VRWQHCIKQVIVLIPLTNQAHESVDSWFHHATRSFSLADYNNYEVMTTVMGVPEAQHHNRMLVMCHTTVGHLAALTIGGVETLRK